MTPIQHIHTYRLELTVFCSGAVVMIFELAGSRVLGPFIGTSIFVWTSIIGIILGSLSIGYYGGGRLADRYPNVRMLSRILLAASIAVLLSITLKDALLIRLTASIQSIKIVSILGSILLFAPASALLGMVSPYAAKLKIDELHHSGSTVGTLYAISTVGSIAGTFLAGFFLIPALGTTMILILLCTILILLSLLMQPREDVLLRIGVLALIAIVWGGTYVRTQALEAKNFFDLDTQYSRVWVFDAPHTQTNRMVRSMQIGASNSAAMFLDDENELVFDYLQHYALAEHFVPKFTHSLLIGGAAYTYPAHYLAHYPDATIDVIEIDPALTDIARTHFNLKDNPRLAIYHEDARTFLNRADTTYDVIFGDAFSSLYSIPFQLTTREAVRKKFDLLSDNGAVLLNIISPLTGNGASFLAAEYATYQSVFPNVYLYQVRDAGAEKIQNVILVASKAASPTLESDAPKLQALLDRRHTAPLPSASILTDEHAPVQYMVYTMLQ